MTTSTSNVYGVNNPLLRESDLPYGLFPFANLEEGHFLPAFECVADTIKSTMEALAKDASQPTFANTVEPLERDSIALGAVLNILFTLTGSDTTDRLQAIEEELAPRIAALEDTILLNREVLERLTTLRGDTSLTPEQAHIVERRINDMTLAGAALDPQEAAEVRQLNGRIAVLNAEFGKRLLADTTDLAVRVESRDELDGLTDSEIDALADADGGYVVALTYPTGHPYLARLTNRALRERIMRASLARCSRGNENDTRELITEIAKLRAHRAALLGFDSHAAWATAKGTAKTTDAVLQMLTPIAKAAGANAKREIGVLQELAREDGVDDFQAWDHAYYTERLRKQQYDVDLDGLRPYFEAEKVLQDGVFGAARRLYGLTFELRPQLRGWNDDTRVYEVNDESGAGIGLYLLDLYARPNKRGGAWMHSLRDQNEFALQAPIICNNLNVPKPAPGEPTLMTFDEVETFFHEFGHALHGLLSEVRYPSVSGTAVEVDFVEFPSQVNELWMLEPSVVGNYGRHVESGEGIPKQILTKLSVSKTFNQGFETSELVGAALIDFHWHLLEDGEEVPDVETLTNDVRVRYGLAHEALPLRYALPYFQHIFDGGYAASYYGYLWSEILDADASEWFTEHGGPTRENGKHFKDTVLKVGGSKDSLEAFARFRGRPARVDALLRRRGLTAEQQL